MINGANGNAKPIISARDLHKRFMMGDNEVHALKGIDLDIHAGQFIGIMGPSGSGKSTLMYLLGGLDIPTGGTVAVQGQRLDLLSNQDLAHFRGQMVGFVFQNYQLIGSMNALENAALPGIFFGLTRDEREERAYRLLRMLRMDDRADHKPNQLSGGQQQRVAIARALFNNPPIIMGDEPTGALDSRTGEVVMRMLQALSWRRGKTVLIVSHDMGVEQYADRMVLLRDGLVVDDYLTDNRAKALAEGQAAALPESSESSTPPDA